MKKEVILYSRFERFWHWTQALLILFLIVTGFEVHDSYELFGFENAVKWHNIAAYAFLVLIIFAVFWHFVTGQWQQYIPTKRFLKAYINYYLLGIFKKAPHPTKKTVLSKMNPLQRITYLALNVLVIPVQVITGLLYLYYNYPESIVHIQGLQSVALIHTFGAFLLIAFVILHVYLTTTGHTIFSNIKAMVTGYEVLDVEPENEDLNNVLQTTGAGFFRLNREGRYTEVNDAYLQLYKYESAEEILGKHVTWNRDKENSEKIEKVIEKVFAGEKIPHGELQRRTKDGEIAYHTFSIAPMYENEKIVGAQGFIIDITETKKRELELEKDKESLKKAFEKTQKKQE